METNEQGLTKEEKIMFGILGIILIIAVGVLIINSLSANERKLEDNKTPITENKGQEDIVEDETTTSDQEENLIEDVPVENVVINTVASKKPSKKPTQIVVKPSKPSNKNEQSEIPGIIEWNFKDSMITEAYSNTIINIDKNVVLKDGKEVEAVVTVRKLEGNSWNIVDISNNKLTVTKGTYKYYYTYGNQTKELLLTVKEKIEIEDITLLKLDATYEEDSTITEEEYNNLIQKLQVTKIEKEENNYKLTTTEDNQKLIPIVLHLKEELTEPILSSNTIGITPSIEQNNWYEELTSNNIIIWLDLTVLDITTTEFNLNINGENYYFDLNIEITTSNIPSDEPTIPEDGTTSTPEDDGENNLEDTDSKLEYDKETEKDPSESENNDEVDTESTEDENDDNAKENLDEIPEIDEQEQQNNENNNQVEEPINNQDISQFDIDSELT